MLNKIHQRFCIVGGDGVIGSTLCKSLREDGFDVRSSTRRKPLDVTTQFTLELNGDLRSFFNQEFDVVVLAASMTKLSDCRRNPEKAKSINIDAQLSIAGEAVKRGAFVVFLSSNQVFDGTLAKVSISEQVSPRSIYGILKAQAEAKLLQLGSNVAIVRMTKVISRRLNLLETWRQELVCGRTITAFDDLVMAPIAIDKVVAGIARVGCERLSGVWHLGGYEDISYLEVGRLLARHLGADQRLVQASSAAEAGIPDVERPPHAALASIEFEMATGIRIAEARTELAIGLGFVSWP